MKKLSILLLLVLIPSFVFAQNQGDATPLGSGGTKILCNSNEAGTETVSADGKLNFVSCTKKGGIVNTVVGETVTITNAVTVTAAAYTAGDLVGGKNTLASAVRTVAGSGVIQSVMIADKAAQAGSYDVIYFSADPSGTTFTDKAAFTPADADLLKIICRIEVTSTSTFADNGITSTSSVGCAFEVPSGTSIYAAIVARSAPTYASTSDVQLRTTIFQD